MQCNRAFWEAEVWAQRHYRWHMNKLILTLSITFLSNSFRKWPREECQSSPCKKQTVLYPEEKNLEVFIPKPRHIHVCLEAAPYAWRPAQHCQTPASRVIWKFSCLRELKHFSNSVIAWFANVSDLMLSAVIQLQHVWGRGHMLVFVYLFFPCLGVEQQSWDSGINAIKTKDLSTPPPSDAKR